MRRKYGGNTGDDATHSSQVPTKCLVLCASHAKAGSRVVWGVNTSGPQNNSVINCCSSTRSATPLLYCDCTQFSIKRPHTFPVALENAAAIPPSHTENGSDKSRHVLATLVYGPLFLPPSSHLSPPAIVTSTATARRRTSSAGRELPTRIFNHSDACSHRRNFVQVRPPPGLM